MHWAVPACVPGASTAGRSPAARSRRWVERLRARARPCVLAAACVAIASVGRSGDWEISGNGTTTMCCGFRDARTAFPQRRRALFASTPGRSANATRFHSFRSRQVEAEEVRSSPASSPAGERRPAKGRSTTDGNPSSLPTQALNRTVRARRRELRNAALSARSKGPYRTWVRSRGQPLRRVEETSRAERLPGFQALTKSSRHGRITLVRRTQRFGRGLSCTRPPGFRRPSCKRFLFEL